MKPRTLLVLLVVVAGLAAFIWTVERDLPSSEERIERGKKLLGGLEAPEVEAVVLEWDDQKVRLERQPAATVGSGGGEEGGGSESEETAETAEPETPELVAERPWRIAAPAEFASARADSATVDRLLQRVVDLERTRTVEGVDPVEMGLDKPRAKLTLISAGKNGAQKETVLAVGAEVPASTATLVAIDDRPEAYVVDGGFVSQLTRAPGDWRDRRVFTADRADIRRVTLRHGAAAGPVVLARRGATFWLEHPIADRADRDKVDKLLGDLTGLSVERFVDHPEKPLSELGLDPPAATVEVELAGGSEPFRLELGAPAAGAAAAPSAASTGGEARFARAGTQLVVAQTPLGEAVDRPVADWQARALSALFLYQIDRATIERAGGTKLTLEREASEWKRGGEKIPYTPVSELLYALTDARAERFVGPAEARRQGVDLDSPTLTVILAGQGEPGDSGAAEGAGGGAGEAAERSETLRFFAPAPALGGQVPAAVSGRDFVLMLAQDTADKILDKLDRVEKAEAVKPEPPSPGPAPEAAPPAGTGGS